MPSRPTSVNVATGVVTYSGVDAMALASSLDKFAEVQIPDDGSSTAGWPDRLAFYFWSGSAWVRTGYFNEYGELRSRKAKTSTVSARFQDHASTSTVDILQVTNSANDTVYLGVSRTLAAFGVPVTAPNVPVDLVRTTDGTDSTGNTTLISDAVLTMALGVGTWVIEGNLNYRAAAAADLKLRFDFGGTATVTGTAPVPTTSATSSATNSINAGLRNHNSNFTAGGVDGSDVAVPFRLVAIVTVAGTFTVQYAQSTSNASACLLLAGSSLSYRKVSP
jgi:hypothetical protein